MTKNQLVFQANLETMRANRARENETLRNNMATESETVRSNMARENENFRSNVAKENETNRSNTVKESETKRHNVQDERLKALQEVNRAFGNVTNAMEGVRKMGSNIGEVIGSLIPF
nr:putative ORF1 [Marmot picobirnavirus]